MGYATIGVLVQSPKVMLKITIGSSAPTVLNWYKQYGVNLH